MVLFFIVLFFIALFFIVFIFIVLLALFIDVLSVMLDIIILACFFPTNGGSTEKFSAVIAIFNLVFR